MCRLKFVSRVRFDNRLGHTEGSRWVEQHLSSRSPVFGKDNAKQLAWIFVFLPNMKRSFDEPLVFERVGFEKWCDIS